jgi:hypothetical protein
MEDFNKVHLFAAGDEEINFVKGGLAVHADDPNPSAIFARKARDEADKLIGLVRALFAFSFFFFLCLFFVFLILVLVCPLIARTVAGHPILFLCPPLAFFFLLLFFRMPILHPITCCKRLFYPNIGKTLVNGNTPVTLRRWWMRTSMRMRR